MSYVELGSLPLVPLTLSKTGSVSFQCSNDGKRVVYGTTNGVVSRLIPDQVDMKSKLVESFIGSHRPVEAAALSYDGTYIAGGDSGGTVYIWTQNREGVKLKVHNLGMHYVRITDLSFSDDSQRLAVVGLDKYSRKLGVCILTDAGNTIGTLEGHTLGIHSVSFRRKKPYLIATAGADGLLCLHTGPPFKLLKSFSRHSNQSVNCVRFSHCGEYLISCGTDGCVNSWSLRNGEVDRSIKLSDYSLLSLAWSPDNTRFVVVGLDKHIRIVQLDNGTVVDDTVLTTSAPETPVGVQWTTTDWIIVVTASGKLWGLKTTNTLKFVSDHYFVWQGLYSPPTTISKIQGVSEAIVFGDSLGTLLFLSGQDSEPRARSVLHLPTPSTIRSIVNSGKLGAVVTGNGTIFIFYVPSMNSLINKPTALAAETFERQNKLKHESTNKQLKLPKSVGSSITQFVDQQIDGFTYVQTTGEALLSRPEEARWICSHQFKEGPVNLCIVDQESAVIVFCSNGCVYAYPFSTSGNNFTPLWSTRLEGTITSVAATSDGSLIAVSLIPDKKYSLSKLNDKRQSLESLNYFIEIYEIDDSTLEGFRFVCVYDHHEYEITAMALNSIGTYLASADTERNIYVVEIETGRKIITNQWTDHVSKILCLSWSLDGTKLASGSIDNNVYVWDINTQGQLCHIKDFHQGCVTCLEFIYNNVLLTGRSDGLIGCYELTYPEEPN